MKTVRLRVVLRDVEPALARVVDVPASATLPELHELLQAAIGWTDSHLHQFVTPQETYGMELPGQDVWPEDQRDETDVALADLGTKFEYLYDFGDGWTHDVEVLGPGSSAPGCVDGHGACPPEDCGGPGGYAELLDALADPTHSELDGLLRGVGLLRLRHGVLSPTRAAGDDLAIVRRLRSAFEPHTFATEITELTIGVLAAYGPLPLRDLASRVHPLLGRGWQRDGQPIEEEDVRMAIAQQSPIMTGLDVLDHPDWHMWASGPAALSLLPGATTLARIWTT